MSDGKPLRALILGDSHVRYMSHGVWNRLYAPREVAVCEVRGATAAGLTNTNSLTNALGKYRQFLRKRDRRSIVAIHLGEVDCGVLIWLRANTKGIPITESLAASVSSYFSFVDTLLAEGFRKIVVTGATLPTINDTDQVGAVVNERRSKVRATQLERTELTYEFNDHLRRQAESRGLMFIDAREDVIDPNTGLVGAFLRNENPADHHMDMLRASEIWATRLNAAFSAYDPTWTAEAKNLAVRSEWQAVARSFVKATRAPADRLPDHLKIAVHAGDRLIATLLGSTEATLFVSGASLNGQALPADFRFIHSSHWSACG